MQNFTFIYYLIAFLTVILGERRKYIISSIFIDKNGVLQENLPKSK